MKDFVPIGPLWSRPLRPAIRSTVAFGVAMAASASGAHWWLHDPAAQILTTIGLILFALSATDAVRYWWWRRASRR